MSADLPRITVITPSYNQEKFLEETICSVLEQHYPNLEYMVIDGGSMDGSVEIIQKYAPRLAYWVSEKDRGQSHAINKGLQRATGEWVAWLNSDDLYAPGALLRVAETARKNPKSGWIVGNTVFVDESLKPVRSFPRKFYGKRAVVPAPEEQDWLDFVCKREVGINLPQQSSFWKLAGVRAAGMIDERYHLSMDNQLYGRLARIGLRPVLIEDVLAYFRLHKEQKTGTNYVPMALEAYRVTEDWIQILDGAEKKRVKRYRGRVVWNLAVQGMRTVKRKLERAVGVKSKQ